VQKLLRQTDNVIFSFDGDAAGRRAARRALEACLPHASDSRALKFLFLPTEHDPDSYVREHGTSQFERLVQDATPLSQFLINEVTEGKDLGTAEGRARAQFDAKPLIQAMPPSALRLQVLRQLAQVTDSTPQELEGLFELAASRSPSRAPGPAVRRKPPVELERQVLRLLLAHPGMHDVLDNLALDLIAQTAPDEGVTLRAVVQAAAGLPAGASLGVLSEALRAQGVELGSLIAEIAAEPMSEPDLARKELSGAIRQTRMKSLRAELERLAATGLGSDTEKARYREISVELEKLRAVADKEGRD
jgi:DNA primase